MPWYKYIWWTMKGVLHDTLKRPNAQGVIVWDWAQLTMFTSWLLVIWFAVQDFIINGIRMDVFSILVGVAVGTKGAEMITDRISKWKSKKSDDVNIG